MTRGALREAVTDTVLAAILVGVAFAGWMASFLVSPVSSLSMVFP